MKPFYSLIVADLQPKLNLLTESIVKSETKAWRTKSFKQILHWCLEEAIERVFLVSVAGHEVDPAMSSLYSELKPELESDLFSLLPLPILQSIRDVPLKIKISGTSIFIYKDNSHEVRQGSVSSRL